jgi:hypothetical protein
MRMPTTTLRMAIVAAALLQPPPATWTLVEDLWIGAHDGPSALTVVSHATTDETRNLGEAWPKLGEVERKVLLDDWAYHVQIIV